MPKHLVLLGLFLLTACGGEHVYHQGEDFARDGRHRRELAATPDQACAAVRAVLLGDGYRVLAQQDGANNLAARKEFKEENNRHGVLQLFASCEAATGSGAVVYMTALEEHFDVATTEKSTAVGLPVVTPFTYSSTTTAEAMLKRSGETVSDSRFYDRFYAAVQRELKGR